MTSGWKDVYRQEQRRPGYGLLKDYEDGTLRNLELLFPDSGATKAAFAAYLANIQPTAPAGSALELNVTLRITGPAAWS